jgi:NAD(P)-dependent dehydrogenase (short-subunit alcohol dehydrogenase family)
VEAELSVDFCLQIVINNAGILRDKSFKAMTDAEFDAIVAVHITGSYAIAHAAWQKVSTLASELSIHPSDCPFFLNF